MSISFGAYESAVHGVKVYQAAFDRAAQEVVKSTVTEAVPTIESTQSAGAGAQESQSTSDRLLTAMAEMMAAHRAFTASLRVLETADDMVKETVERLG
jgi:flagellar basal body rod protein FlgC